MARAAAESSLSEPYRYLKTLRRHLGWAATVWAAALASEMAAQRVVLAAGSVALVDALSAAAVAVMVVAVVVVAVAVDAAQSMG